MKNRLFFLFNSISSALLFIFSFPGYGLDFLAWVALIPLFFAISNQTAQKIKSGLIAGIFIYTGSLIWLASTISQYGGLPFISSFAAICLLGTYMGIYTAIFSVLFPDIQKKPFTALFWIPAIWTGLDFISSFAFSGFPWVFIGYTQYRNLHIAQTASVFGIYGVTYLIVLVNTALFITIHFVLYNRQFLKKLIPIYVCVIFILTAAITYSHFELKKTKQLINKSENAKILLAQANILPDEKHSGDIKATMKKYFELIKNQPPHDITIWPETALPYPVLLDKNLRADIKTFASNNGNQLIGTLDVKKINNQYILKNRAVLITKNQESKEYYDKIHLVPFGEYIPLKKYFPFLAKFIVPSGEFESGSKNNIISTDKINAGVKICFEIIFPGLVRQQVNNGAEIIINMTNDAWFGNSPGPYQHLAISVFRSIENKRAIARCANTGISAFILPTGEIKTRTKVFEAAVVSNTLPLIKEKTIYTIYGDFFAFACLFVVISSGFLKYIKFRKI